MTERRGPHLPLVEVNTLMGVFVGAFVGLRAASRPASEVMPAVSGAILLLAMFLVGLRGWAERRQVDADGPKAWRALIYAVVMGGAAAYVMSLTGLVALGGSVLIVGCWFLASVCAVFAADFLEL